MKILIHIMSMQKGGAERVVANLSNYFAQTDDIILVTTLKENVEYNLDKNIQVYSLYNKTKKKNKLSRLMSKISLNNLNKMKKIINAIKPDVILGFLPEPSFRLLVLKKFVKKIKSIPIIISVRNDPKIEYHNKIIHFIMQKLYPIAEGFVFQTQEAKNYFKKILNCKTIVIANPISQEFITERYSGEREKKIVTVGRLEKQKNQKLLIKAFGEIHKKYPDYILEIYGEGKLKYELMNYIKEMNLSNCVFLKGKTDSIKEKIYKAKAFVLSSNYEGMPNALMEALALGVPCISTDCPCGGPRELIQNNVNGILVENNNCEEMVKAIYNVIENEKLNKTLSVNSNNMKEEFLISKIADKWKKFINEIREN